MTTIAASRMTMLRLSPRNSARRALTSSSFDLKIISAQRRNSHRQTVRHKFSRLCIECKFAREPICEMQFLSRRELQKIERFARKVDVHIFKFSAAMQIRDD